MSDTQRTLALAGLHTLIAAAALTPAYRAFEAWNDYDISLIVDLSILALLALVTWWTTRCAISQLPRSPRSLIDTYITTGVRSGALGGLLYGQALLLFWVVVAFVAVTFLPDGNRRYNLIGGRYAFLWMAALASPLFAVAGVVFGAILGGVIATIDRTLVAITHWVPRTSNPDSETARPMPASRRLVALSAVHFLVAAVVLTPMFRVLVSLDGSSTNAPLVVDLALLSYLAVVTWWVTRRVASKPPKSPRFAIDPYVIAGARSGGIGGVLYLWGILAVMFVWGVKFALFGPHPYEWALVWEEWAFLWLTAVLIPVLGLTGFLLGAILGGVLATIDRTLVAIAHWALGTSSR